ncbi:MAG: hypothetical protein NTW93_08165 [Phycisphaerae bacterium]|nr:hypothetical protein [Phycisphaerae bacterium]
MLKKITHKNGYAMLVILIAVVIIALLYMIDLTAMFGPRGTIDIYAQRPWFEEKRLLSEKDFPIKQTGKKGKVVIKDETVLAGAVQRDGENRGDVKITIDPNGKAYGHWNCAYQYPDSSYTIDANLAGNIDPNKIYEDKTGKNKQLLYLITKGKYQQIKTDIKTNNQWTSEEVIYVVGWIHPVRDKLSSMPDDRQRQPVSNGIRKDYAASGKLFLMTADGGNAEYDWQTGQIDLKNADKTK